ncbi:MAG: aconitate hydratase AcnA [Bacteroidia bacterium]|nr:aconitate hydratase AcnA [Bacteroidia bacterium]MCX7651310.1 aconitate hydratase AcnA [Bacteroidia bacterium]MDW8417329.1 aconitate hydratase AcnA [Bacteroidia bacterium]
MASWKEPFVDGLGYIALPKAAEALNINLAKLPYSLRVLLENVLRNLDGFKVTEAHLSPFRTWDGKPSTEDEVAFIPARVLMQDFTGVPAVVDLASLRDAVAVNGKDPRRINPLVPVDLVIDHSVQVDSFGNAAALQRNIEREYQQNQERYQFLKWAQQAFSDFRIVPPGMGIVHQVNLEYLAQVVVERNGLAFPDTAVGTDSHTPMVNGIGVVAWGVGGIEAEAAMLGQPFYFPCPEVIGLQLTGRLRPGVTATDLVLTITELLRKVGVVDKFVEVFGPGLDALSVPDRATISNMSPEFGCTITYFPIDDQTLAYLRLTGRDSAKVERIRQYAQANRLWRESEEEPIYTRVVTLDLESVEPSVAGPRRPQDRIPLSQVKVTVQKSLETTYQKQYHPTVPQPLTLVKEHAPTNGYAHLSAGDAEYVLSDGAVVIAAITSCTNTSNPSVLLAAGLVAKRAVAAGLRPKPWVKTTLAPGSRVVTRYLEKAGLLPYLEALHFHVAGYGCTTCIGNSGALPTAVSEAIQEKNLVVAAVLSGNRNFEARVHPQVRMNFLASPPLVVAYALAGRVDIDFEREPIGYDPDGYPVYLRDIWFNPEEVAELMGKVIDESDFRSNYATIFQGEAAWQSLAAPQGDRYAWDATSTYIRQAPFFEGLSAAVPPLRDITDARVLLILGDSVTTDHISPAGSIASQSPAGKYLIAHGVEPKDFNSYGARRGNHEVMMRGTFANVRLKNKLVDREGGWTIHHPTGEVLTVYDAAMRYQSEGTPLIVLAGKEYGSGSSRDWAAKGPNLLGIKAVIAESYERIHRSNLVGMGILPLQFMEGENVETLGLTGKETYHIEGIADELHPLKVLTVRAVDPAANTEKRFAVKALLRSDIEIAYYQHGGVLHYVLRTQFLK